MKRTDIKGCSACSGLDHNVQSCEDERAVAYWRDKAAAARQIAKDCGTYQAVLIWTKRAATYTSKADNLERRLRGEPLPVGQATARLRR